MSLSCAESGQGARALAASCSWDWVLDVLALDAAVPIARRFETVRLMPGAVVVEEGDAASHAYFPVDCVISLQCATREGASVEFGLIGAEGVVGMEVLLEHGRMHGRAVVIRPGQALRLPAQDLRDLFRRHERFRFELLNFYAAFNAQVIRRSICHRVHTTERRLCTWLLLLHDRARKNTLELAHEVVAGLLGGRREGVTLAIKRLREQGLARTARASVTLLDRAALEAHGCECYAAIREQYTRLLPAQAPTGVRRSLDTVLQYGR